MKLDFSTGNGSSHSHNKHEFEGGYVFLPCCEDFPTPLSDDKLMALKAYWHKQGWPNADTWPNAVCHWAKLQLPNGQNAHSMWYKSTITTKLHWALCVEVGHFACLDRSSNIDLLSAD
jgi:hypothetical protein